ncbi:MAG: multidrug efflux SMR transporter [Kurthia sp.]|nr:multidrug efflux SMR transporter [Candidatus Kurthia equi]
MKNWGIVIFAAILEVCWVIGLTHANTWWEWVLTIFAVVFTFKLLLDAGNHLPVGTLYAVFVGLGTAGTVLSDIIFFGAPIEFMKIFLIVLLLIGVIGIKMVTPDNKGGH